MTEVYIDVAAASLESGAAIESSSTTMPAPSDPEALRALRLLGDAGIRIVVVQHAAAPGEALRAIAAEVVRVVPDRPAGPAWYLTSDVDRCQGSSARLRTVLVGATPPSGSVRRCDAVARDVQAAVLEILAADVMAPRPGAAS